MTPDVRGGDAGANTPAGAGDSRRLLGQTQELLGQSRWPAVTASSDLNPISISSGRGLGPRPLSQIDRGGLAESSVNVRFAEHAAIDPRFAGAST